MTASNDCIFCKIIAGNIPAPKLHEDADFICIADIRPQAKKHLLVVPKRHIASLDQAFPETGVSETMLIGRMMETGTRIARKQGMLPEGFRAVINTGDHGGQTVHHIHLHLLGGGPLNGDFG